MALTARCELAALTCRLCPVWLRVSRLPRAGGPRMPRAARPRGCRGCLPHHISLPALPARQGRGGGGGGRAEGPGRRRGLGSGAAPGGEQRGAAREKEEEEDGGREGAGGARGAERPPLGTGQEPSESNFSVGQLSRRAELNASG